MGSPERFGGAFNDDPLHRALGMTLVERRPGFARLLLATSEREASAGLLGVLADAAVFQAVAMTLGADEGPGGTADLNMSFMGLARGTPFVAEATVIKKGRRLVVVEVSVFDGADELCACARVTQVVSYLAAAVPQPAAAGG